MHFTHSWRAALPLPEFQRLQISHLADDDNVYWLGLPDQPQDIQLDYLPDLSARVEATDHHRADSYDEHRPQIQEAKPTDLTASHVTQGLPMTRPNRIQISCVRFDGS